MTRVVHAYTERSVPNPAEMSITATGPNVYDLAVRGRRAEAGQFIRLTSCQLLEMADAIQAAFRPAHRR